ncbi:MAG: hypothetical protein M1838_001551 [Thelocarpon superellum]|nr:MAG: hypothetical protein M1838_001551 [Thelocarpon superellum]
MPQPALPPTPSSSTDLAGNDNQHLSQLEGSFTLPPPAISGKGALASPNALSKSSVPVTHPLSPTSPSATGAELTMTRRRSSLVQATIAGKDDFTLPPPPTRSRKIIQMKPRPQGTSAAESVPSTSRATNKAPVPPAPSTSGKKKTPSTTSVAGRKIARKTAHSLIERRRRSKMNEEFGVLKQMIPACKDQEMHKLAILQASIEYTRYLEQCITDLKANSQATLPPALERYPASVGSHSIPSSHEYDEDDEEMGDIDDVGPAPTERPTAGSVYSTSASPMLDAQRHYSYSSHSAATSPLFTPQRSHTFPSLSTSASPALLPHARDSRDFDHEATEALLLLNTDRRSQGARGMSVRDLLST